MGQNYNPRVDQGTHFPHSGSFIGTESNPKGQKYHRKNGVEETNIPSKKQPEMEGITVTKGGH